MEKIDLREDIQYGVEMQGSFSKGKTPLWLNANKHGLSSLEKNNGYLRGSLVRPLSADSARRWAVGYGVDVAVPVNYTSHVVVQQAYVEARWLYGVLTAGAKEYPMELKNRYDDPAYREKREELTGLLYARMKAAGDFCDPEKPDWGYPVKLNWKQVMQVNP